MSAAHHPQQNHILRALPPEVSKRVVPHLELVRMPLGRVLYDSAGPLQEVHFPTDAVVAPLHAARDDATAQIAVIGNEGMAGCTLFVAGEAAMRETVVQCAGHAFRLSGEVLQRECSRNTHLYALLLRYTQALIAQMAQTVSCNLHHPLEQRLCRWLLLTLDRLSSNELPIQQEVIEKVMGESRDRVSETLDAFDALGVIQRGPERLTVPDRRRLELAACECYSIVRSENEPPRARGAEKLMDVFPELVSAVVNGLSSTDQGEFIKQLRGALVRGVDYDLDADSANILLAAVYSPRAVKRNVFASAHGRKIPIECQYWVNLDTDPFGRITAIEILHPPKALKQKIMLRARA
jgi:CRP-like cAMP-binding protein